MLICRKFLIVPCISLQRNVSSYWPRINKSTNSWLMDRVCFHRLLSEYLHYVEVQIIILITRKLFLWHRSELRHRLSRERTLYCTSGKVSHTLSSKSSSVSLQNAKHDNRDYTGCPTRYRTRHFFNNFNTNEDIQRNLKQTYLIV